MNNYPIWWDTTITVFNQFTDPNTQIVSWTKTVLENCFWKLTGDKISVGETVLETNSIICRIPKNENYLEAGEWIALDNDQRVEFFTLKVGDIIIKGEVEDEIDEYTKGQRSSDILAKYKALQGCMEVKVSASNVGPGRCNEHYYAKGV